MGPTHGYDSGQKTAATCSQLAVGRAIFAVSRTLRKYFPGFFSHLSFFWRRKYFAWEYFVMLEIFYPSKQYDIPTVDIIVVVVL